MLKVTLSCNGSFLWRIATAMETNKYVVKGIRYQALNKTDRINDATIMATRLGGASCLIFIDLGCLNITFLFQLPY